MPFRASGSVSVSARVIASANVSVSMSLRLHVSANASVSVSASESVSAHASVRCNFMSCCPYRSVAYDDDWAENSESERQSK